MVKAKSEEKMILTNTYHYDDLHATVRIHRPDISPEELQRRLENIVRHTAEIIDRAMAQKGASDG